MGFLMLVLDFERNILDKLLNKIALLCKVKIHLTGIFLNLVAFLMEVYHIFYTLIL